MKRYYHKRYKSPRSEINRLQEAIKREKDPIVRENFKQHLEHWYRVENNHKKT